MGVGGSRRRKEKFLSNPGKKISAHLDFVVGVEQELERIKAVGTLEGKGYYLRPGETPTKAKIFNSGHFFLEKDEHFLVGFSPETILSFKIASNCAFRTEVGPEPTLVRPISHQIDGRRVYVIGISEVQSQGAVFSILPVFGRELEDGRVEACYLHFSHKVIGNQDEYVLSITWTGVGEEYVGDVDTRESN